MNKENECSIVEDLLYSYNEKLLNQKSKEFVDEHLRNCNNCSKKLEKLREKICIEKEKEKQEDITELTHLLKINKVMRILKVGLIISITIILLFLGSICIKSNRSEYVVNNAYNKLEELKEIDNFKITKTIKYISHGDALTEDVTTEIYYKDGKYKKIMPGSIFFYEDESNQITYVFENLKSIEKNNKTIITHKGDYFNEEMGIRSIYNNEKNPFQKAMYEIRNDIYNGINCYVVRKEKNNEYSELWINKENFITVRSVENYTEYYREIIYDIIINETLDSEVTLNKNDYREYTFKDLTENRDVMIYND